MLKDNDIRVTLIDELNRINAQHDYRIIEELAVCDGEARVDVAVANGRLCGYEIKSDADTLEIGLKNVSRIIGAYMLYMNMLVDVKLRGNVLLK